jgi:hypothetical protein
MSFVLVVFFLYVLPCVLSLDSVWKVNDSTRLISYPMIMSHDSASGEIVPERDHVLADWTRTQDVGLVPQLDCGARSFDYRPIFGHDNIIYAHHGGVTIHVPMATSVKDIMSWANKHPEDLIVLYLSHWEGDNCKEEVAKLLDSMKINTIEDCNVLKTITYGEAKKQSALKLGGSLMAVYDCTEEYFDQKINCYSKDFTCYDSWPENTKSVPFTNLANYMKKTTATDPTVLQPIFWMAQAHWQSTASSITFGTLHNSSVVQDERRSQVNLYIEQSILNHSYPFLNFLELDELCDRGTEIYQAIKTVYISN